MCRRDIPFPAPQEYAYPEAELQELRRLDVVDLLVFRVYY
jgi:hypothetical protein